jgi:hypothetical protein
MELSIAEHMMFVFGAGSLILFIYLLGLFIMKLIHNTKFGPKIEKFISDLFTED